MNVTVNTHPTLVSAAEQFENTVNCVMRPCRYMYTILPLAGIPFPKCTRNLVYRIQKPCIVAENHRRDFSGNGITATPSSAAAWHYQVPEL